MLKSMRNKTKTIIWVIIIAFVGTVFVSWGMRLGSPRARKVNAAAEVNGKTISLSYLRDSIHRQYGKYYERANEERKKRIKDSVLEQIIDRVILLEEAKRQKIKISDEEVVNRIKDYYFKTEENKFDQEKYKEAVKNIPAQRWRMLEEGTRDYLMLEKLRKRSREWVKVTPKEVENYYIKNNEEVKIRYILIEPKDFVELKKVEEYYGKNKEEYRIPEQVRARHILIKLEPEAGLEIEKEAQAKAEKILKELKKGEDFAELAKKFSDCPSGQKGGDLGFFTYGRMDPEFSKAAFGLKKGETSKLVKSSFGYHIIKLEEKKPSSIQSLKEVEERIRRKLVGEEEEGKAEERAEKISKERDQKFEETGFFKPGGFIPKLGWAPEVAKAAFSLKDGEFSKVIKTQKGYAIIQLAEKKEIDREKFRKEKEKTAERLLQQKSSQIYNEWLQQLKNRAKIKKF
jgi:peptidyl-prolyl cis-trans isomerase D